MKRNSKVLHLTTNSKEYKRLKGSLVSGCPICSPHKGCNRLRKRSSSRSWKNNRKTKWK